MQDCGPDEPPHNSQHDDDLPNRISADTPALALAP